MLGAHLAVAERDRTDAVSDAPAGGRSLVVEFLGLPGVGKSSVSRRVAEILAERGLRVAQPTYSLDHGPGKLERSLRKSLCVVAEVLSHPRYLLRSARALRATRQESAAVHLKMLFNWLLVSYLMRRAHRRSGIHLHDQGLFQGLWSIGLGSETGSLRRMGLELAPSVPAPSLVVIIEADLQAVERRLGARGGRHSRADAWRHEDMGLFRRSSSLLDEAKELLHTPAGPFGTIRTILVRNDQDGDTERIATLLAREIAQVYKERTR